MKSKEKNLFLFSINMLHIIIYFLVVIYIFKIFDFLIILFKI